jgi:hypothetical protein
MLIADEKQMNFDAKAQAPPVFEVPPRRVV